MELIREDDTLNQGRKKLNNAIKAFNETVVEGDSSVEAAQARVDENGEVHPTLKARIDDGFTKVASQLAQTATKEELNEKADKTALTIGLSTKRDKDVEIEMKDLSQEVKEVMTGGSVAVVGNDAVGTSNLKDGAVTRKKLHKNILTNTPWISGEEKNLDYVFDEGNYMVGASVINNPFKKPAYLTVNRYKVNTNSNETTIKQTLTNVEGVELSSLYRMIRYDESNFTVVWMTEWKRIDDNPLNEFMTTDGEPWEVDY